MSEMQVTDRCFPSHCTDVLGAGEAEVKKEEGRPRGKEDRFRGCF